MNFFSAACECWKHTIKNSEICRGQSKRTGSLGVLPCVFTRGSGKSANVAARSLLIGQKISTLLQIYQPFQTMNGDKWRTFCTIMLVDWCPKWRDCARICQGTTGVNLKKLMHASLRANIATNDDKNCFGKFLWFKLPKKYQRFPNNAFNVCFLLKVSMAQRQISRSKRKELINCFSETSRCTVWRTQKRLSGKSYNSKTI